MGGTADEKAKTDWQQELVRFQLSTSLSEKPCQVKGKFVNKGRTTQNYVNSEEICGCEYSDFCGVIGDSGAFNEAVSKKT